MRVYDSLKSLVRQYIKTNGQNEITGQILQNVLIAMIDDLGITIDSAPEKNSLNAVASGGTFDMIQNATNVNAIESTDGKIYNDYQAGDIFFITDNNVREYRVALVAGTADAEHPVTISPVNFYYALNSADAINLSLTLKTVSTEQQSLSTQQKAQARTNIAAVSYEQQSLNAGQQVQAQNNMMGKVYDAATFSGLGKKVLAKNIQTVSGVDHNYMTQDFFKNGNTILTNTVFVIQYDYELKENVEIGAGCTLEFDGGSISGNYTLTGNNTRIKAERVAIFSGVTIAGTWNVGNIYSEWFSDVTQNNNIKKLFALTSANVTNDVYIAAGTYNVSALANGDSIVVPNNNTNIHLSGTIQLAANNYTNYYIVNINGVNNVTIDGGIIIGDRDTHTGTAGEWGMGINIGDAHDITVKNVNVTKCWGDGIYVGGSGNTYNISIDSFTISDCRRQGISVTEVDNATINNGKISKIDGTLPKACIDVEPNSGDTCRNITVSNCNLDNNYNECRGLMLYNYIGEALENVTIKNCYISANYALPIEGTQNVSVESTIVNGTLHVKNASRNVNFKSCEFSLRYIEIQNISDTIHCTNCKFSFQAADTTIPSAFSLDSCRLSMLGHILSIYGLTNSCIVESNRHVELYDNLHKDLTVISTKSSVANDYPVKLYNSKCDRLSINVKDSNDVGSYHGYVYSDNSVVNGVNITSEYTPTVLCHSKDNTRLDNLAFSLNTPQIFDIEGDDIILSPADVNRKGHTSQRPFLLDKGVGVCGFEYFDLSLMKPTYWTGDVSNGKSGWIDAAGANVPNEPLIFTLVANLSTKKINNYTAPVPFKFKAKVVEGDSYFTIGEDTNHLTEVNITTGDDYSTNYVNLVKASGEDMQVEIDIDNSAWVGGVITDVSKLPYSPSVFKVSLQGGYNASGQYVQSGGRADAIGLKFPNLCEFNAVWQTELTGDLSAALGNSINLLYLDLRSTQITGSIDDLCDSMIANGRTSGTTYLAILCNGIITLGGVTIANGTQKNIIFESGTWRENI